MKRVFSLFFMVGVAAVMMSAQGVNVQKNDLPPRLQWNENGGYCGEVSLISAGLYYGQYISQYDARAIALKGAPQNTGQLLLGKNDVYAATAMHLNAVEWNTEQEESTDDFLAWVKQNVVKGYPVAIGIFTNEYLFYAKTDPDAGDSSYDHIVCANGICSAHPLTDPSYYGDDILYFSDNGLWTGDGSTPTYNFNFGFDACQADRAEANAPEGAIYSLLNSGENYGVAITGVIDLNGDTLPVRIETNVNDEEPEIKDKTSVRPAPMPLVLKVTVSELKPGVQYNLYRYSSLAAVPNSAFNAHAKDAAASWKIKINSGSTYVLTEHIQSNEMAIYRAVKAIAP